MKFTAIMLVFVIVGEAWVFGHVMSLLKPPVPFLLYFAQSFVSFIYGMGVVYFWNREPLAKTPSQ